MEIFYFTIFITLFDSDPCGILECKSSRAPDLIATALLAQVTVCVATGSNWFPDEEDEDDDEGAGAGAGPAFSFVLRNGGSRIPGVHLAMMAKQGAFPGWSVEITDAGSIEDEVGRGGERERERWSASDAPRHFKRRRGINGAGSSSEGLAGQHQRTVLAMAPRQCAKRRQMQPAAKSPYD